MPLLTFKDITQPLTRKEVEETVYAILERLDVPTTGWKPGAVGRAIITAFSAVVAALTVLLAALARSAFLDTAEGVWLTLVAKWVFGVDRIAATYATGEITLTNGGGGLYVLEAEDLIFRSPTTDKTYVNAEPVTIQPLQSVTVKIRAQEVGSESIAPPGTITELVTTLNGVTCSNAASIVGFDEERDEALRERCMERPSALSPFGPEAAYRYWAKTAERDGVNLGVTRVKVTRLSDRGEVGVWVARPTGGLPSEDLAYLEKFLEEMVVPLGVTMYLQNAQAKDIGIDCQVWVKSSRDEAAIQAAVTQRIDALFRSIDIGGEILVENEPGHVFRDAIIEAIRGALPGEIVRVVVSSPSGDVELAEDEIPVLDVDATMISVTRVT